jgi:hypothetical protein
VRVEIRHQESDSGQNSGNRVSPGSFKSSGNGHGSIGDGLKECRSTVRVYRGRSECAGDM